MGVVKREELAEEGGRRPETGQLEVCCHLCQFRERGDKMLTRSVSS